MEYNFTDIEKRWQKFWAEHKTFKAQDLSNKPKYYVLDMFPYPSGAGLHVGHPLGYIASDIVARYKRHKGFNVLHPMGYDSFGLPAEQYAIQTGQHPKITTEQNIARYREQMDKIGFSFDWDREVRTSDPDYYKWTQWIFIQIFNSWYNQATNKAEKIDSLISEFEKNGNILVKTACDENTKAFSAIEWQKFSKKEKSDILMQYRLAYLGEAYVNWCPALGTVLANDEVKDGVSERGGHPVERKLMKQWSMRITAYAQRLLEGLEKIDWTESLKESQKYWIGKSEGCSLKFRFVDQPQISVEVFTTRPDTVFGVSFITLAPEHELVQQITTAEQKADIDAYILKTKSRSERERQADVNTVSGVFTGAYVVHPFSQKPIPVWIGDYVLAGYGTGAVMAVPGHDERDYKFAKNFNLPILEVIQGGDISQAAYTAKEGKTINSEFLNGLEVKDAITTAIKKIEENKLGSGKVNFRLRDAVFGRQRYWGEPIPVFYKDGIPHALDEKELPLLLPEVDKFLPTEDGEPPLARASASWKKDGKYEYEYTTMPGWAGSSWYFLRYMDPKNQTAFADKKLMDYWQQIDLYIGGSEHATGHLLYVRFWTKFLFDLGYISVDEPIKKLINQGMIQGMSAFFYSFLLKFDQIIKDDNVAFDLPYPELLLISKKSYDDILAGKNPAEIEAWIEKNIFKGAKKNFTPDYNPKATLKRHVDISLLKGTSDDLEMKTFRSDDRYSDFTKATNMDTSDNYSVAREVEKMSKSKLNVVTPDDICEKFGADTLRLYEMFLGPLEQSKPWNTNGITGVAGFLKKLWRLFFSTSQAEGQSSTFYVSDENPTKAELKTLHKTIKKITEDIDRFSFNTSVSNFMICVNELTEAKCNKRAILEPLIICLSPYAPHITEELWNLLGHNDSIAYEKFPVVNENYLIDDAFNYPISFNGKTRLNIELAANLSPAEIENEVMGREEVQKYLEGKTPKKIIIVPKKIVNIVL
jgi:leucyl-tRNA synthetase